MMTTFVSPLASAATVGAGLPDIAPKFDAPWMPTLNNVASMMLGTFLVALVIGLGAGVIIWIFGKLSSSGRAQDVPDLLELLRYQGIETLAQFEVAYPDPYGEYEAAREIVAEQLSSVVPA